jgi:hypothetical protein
MTVLARLVYCKQIVAKEIPMSFHEEKVNFGDFKAKGLLERLCENKWGTFFIL